MKFVATIAATIKITFMYFFILFHFLLVLLSFVISNHSVFIQVGKDFALLKITFFALANVRLELVGFFLLFNAKRKKVKKFDEIFYLLVI